jgi:hypothetical protein
VIEKYQIQMVTCIPNDSPQLASITSMTLAGITEEEKSAGSNKHKNQRRNKS